MESIIREVTTLDANHRRSLEALLGHELRNDQKLFIAVVPAETEPRAVERERAWMQLEQVARRVEANLGQHGVTAEQWIAAADEACEEVRYGKP